MEIIKKTDLKRERKDQNSYNFGDLKDNQVIKEDYDNHKTVRASVSRWNRLHPENKMKCFRNGKFIIVEK